MRSLRSLHEVMARSLSRVFSSNSRAKVDIKLSRINQLVASEFMQNIQNPSAMYVLSVEELGGDIIMVLDPGFCFYMIERQSGGRGTRNSNRRALTTIEEKIMSGIMQSVNKEIVVAWEPYMNFNIRSTTYESKTENVHMISDDPAIVAEFEVELGNEKLDLHISYPYNLLKETMNDSVARMGNHVSKEYLSPEGMEAYQQTLKHVKVHLRPLLGTTRLSIYTLLNMQEGDAIPLDQKIDKPLQVSVNGVNKMTAYPGIVQHRRAVKIYEILEEIKERELL